MYDEDIDIQAIRRRINHRLWRWGSVGVHFVIWMIGSSLVSMQPPSASMVAGGVPTTISAAEAIPAIWFGIVCLHALLMGLLEWRAAALRRAIERERRLLYADKPKRSERLVLSDDGEVVELDTINWEDKHKLSLGE